MTSAATTTETENPGTEDEYVYRNPRREDLEKRMEVFHAVRFGDGEGHVKRTPARVLEVVRAAARLQIEGEAKPRMVRFSEIEVREPKPKPKPKPKKAFKPTQPRCEITRSSGAKCNNFVRKSGDVCWACAKLQAGPELRAEPLAAEGAASVDEWVKQGQALQAQLIEEAHGLENEVAALVEEVAAYERKIEELTGALDKKRKQIEALDLLKSGMGT